MKAVIFAAGLGTRLRPLTDSLPKPMIEVGGKPILQHTLEALPDAVTEVIIVVGYKGDAIREYFKDASGIRGFEQTEAANFHGRELLRFRGASRIRCIEQAELHGTYDALMRARPFLDDAPFLALNGDDLYAKEDLERLAALAIRNPQGEVGFAMLAHRVPSPNPYSHLDSGSGFLKKIVLQKDSERLTEKEVYVGACLLDARFFALEPGLTPGGEVGLPHTLERHLNKIPVRILESTFWMPIGTPEELGAARSHFDRRLFLK